MNTGFLESSYAAFLFWTSIYSKAVLLSNIPVETASNFLEIVDAKTCDFYIVSWKLMYRKLNEHICIFYVHVHVYYVQFSIIIPHWKVKR